MQPTCCMRGGLADRRDPRRRRDHQVGNTPFIGLPFPPRLRIRHVHRADRSLICVHDGRRGGNVADYSSSVRA